MGRIAEGIGLIAGVAALAVGGAAAGMELERRIVSKRIWKDVDAPTEDFRALHSPGPELVTPDGVVLHTEVDPLDDDRSDDDRSDDDPALTPTVVLVHGYALSLECWHYQRLHLRGRYPLVLYDQRSHGRSTRSDPALCRLAQLADDLHQVLTELTEPGRPVVLIGHSMGAMTIMRLARRHPEWFGADAPGGRRVLGVGLTFTSSGEMTDYSPIKVVPGRTFNRVAQTALAGLNRVPDLVESSRRAGTDIGFVVTKRMAFGSDVSADLVEFVSAMLGDTPLEVVADFYPAFADLEEFEGLQLLRTVETAVIGGINDMILPIQHTDKIIEQLPDAATRRIADCGHLGMLEYPEIVNRVLDGMIGRSVGAD